MAGQKVTRAQMLSLLGKLANDDQYRARFAANAPAALKEAGVPDDQADALAKEYLRPGALADKALFQEAHARISSQQSQECMCMVIPSFRLDYGDK
ncbi:MAG TPA: NHLP-related RiPP peptide [Rudaea sp.]